MTGQQQYVNILKQELHKIKELQWPHFFFLVFNFQKVRIIEVLFLRGPTASVRISKSSDYRGFSMRAY